MVGTGIAGIGQVTLEALAAIDSADELFYVVNDAVTEAWLTLRNPTARSLAYLYAEGKDRSDTYAEMAALIIRAVLSGKRVCAVVYGHPGVFTQFTHIAIAFLRKRGYDAKMLAGVSADGCLFADLGWNPGDSGVQSFEATDFLRYRRRFDPTSGLLLWQIGVLGDLDYSGDRRVEASRLSILTKALERHYPPTHRVVLYSANTMAGQAPTIKRFALASLPESKPTGMMTLFIPPRRTMRAPSAAVTRWDRQDKSRRTPARH